MRARMAIGALGVLVGIYGAYLWLSRQELAQIKNAFIWLAGGAILHDAVISMGVIAVAALASRVVPTVAKAPIAVGAIVLGSVTLLAVPMLGRFGEKADNPTLLDRNYTAGWLLVAGVVVGVVGVAVVVASVVRARRGSAVPVTTDGPL